MSQFTVRDVEAYKAAGDYRIAGQLACILGQGPSYGCHFGMRSTRDAAIADFRRGWDEADFAIRNPNVRG